MFQKMRPFALLAVLFFTQNLSSQSTFHAGIIAGFTAAQLDGDDAYGFHKPGLQGGGRVAINLKKRQQLSLEMLFTQRGSKQPEEPAIAAPGFKLRTHYIDIPVQWHYNDWLVSSDGDSYYKVSVNAGLFYGRLLNYKSSCTYEPCDFLDKRMDAANRNDFGWMAGASFFATKHVGFTVRYCRSANLLFNPEKHDLPLAAQKPLKSYFLNLQTMYMF